jgi:hypothetical protein
MKIRSIRSLALFFFIVVCASCKSSSPAATQAQSEKIRQLVNAQSYVFMPQTALPLRGRSIQVSSGFDLEVYPDKIVSYLPYYGNATSVPINSSQNSLDFTTTNFDYFKSERAKGGWDVSIKPRAVTEPRGMQLTIYDNGSADLLVLGTSKDNISFSGYIVEKRK